MDAKLYLHEYRRLCMSFGCCSEDDSKCPLSHLPDCNVESSVDIVEKWSKENPERTRTTEFLKLFPNAKMNKNGVPSIMPCELNMKMREFCGKIDFIDYLTIEYPHGDEARATTRKISCEECSKKYWNEETDKF